MLKKLFIVLVLLFFSRPSYSQKAQDTIFLMNGIVIAKQVIDTTFNTVTIMNPKKHLQKIHYEMNQLYMVKFADGYKRYYYVQDPSIYNEFTRDEMWLFMKGESDARKGFKARGALTTSIFIGFAAGATGTFFAPIAPFGFMALSGVTKVKIKHNTVSNPRYIEDDAYILGYERVARQKRKTKSLIGGTIGLALGYAFYAIFNDKYPENGNIGFNR
ncbi:hypothetical protein [Aurantibacillus circumpalustris]|uniref:hypothetical protein n=1 Tax=Aurantibacillus circumpalustris TaxID=3036359 RepID=UPI00295BDA4C|nr:hypothetical protein [Aurantibacillus circumpalustris]